MKISFELSDKDIRHFRDRLRLVTKARGSVAENRVIKSAAAMVETARASTPPEFVRERIDKLEKLVQMLEDTEWRLEGKDRENILDALIYFVDPDDMIHDDVPVIGYLDDAIMIELVVRELRHEIEAYDDFCRWRSENAKARSTEPTPGLEGRRKALQERMRRRRRRDRRGRRSVKGGSRPPLSLW